MFMNWVLAGMTAVAGYYLVNNRIHHEEVPQAKEADLAVSMSMYRTAVTRYAAEHAAFTGTVQDANLSLPTWYSRYPLWSNWVENGTVVVYPTGPTPIELATEIVKLSGNSMLAGVARNASHTLYSPVFGDTGIGIPAGIPDGTPVWLGRTR